MQKYIFTTLIIISNIIGVFLLVNEKEKTVYPEETVRGITKNINDELNVFLNSIYSEIENIKTEFNSKNNFTQEYLDKYFIQKSYLNKSLFSVFIEKNDLFYIINREEKTLISAFDTLESLNSVKWNRFKNQKLVTSWTELVQLDSVALKWLKISEKSNKVLNWGVGDGKNIEGADILISSIKWTNGKDKYLLIFRYLNGAINVFDKKISKYNAKTLLINTLNDNYIKLSKDTIINITSDKLADSKFTFEKTVIDYTKKLEKINDSIFSFSYNDKLFWAINLELDNKYGIKDFTLTISNDEIVENQKDINLLIILYVVFLILSIILILYLLKILKLKARKINFDSEDTLFKLLNNDEGRYLEFKSSLRWDYRQNIANPELENVILKTIAAFGNSDGGTLLIGVDDDKNIIGLDKDYSSLKKYGADFFEIYLRNILHKHMGVKYVTENLRISFHKFNDKEICKIEIFKANEPLYLTLSKKGNVSEKFYVRSGNSSNELSSLKDINDYIFNRFKK